MSDELDTMGEPFFDADWFRAEINRWAAAYPVSVFSEPDMMAVRHALDAIGITLDSVSASIIRDTLASVISLVDEAADQRD